MIYLFYFYIASVIFALGVTIRELTDKRYHTKSYTWKEGIIYSFIPIVNLFAVVHFFPIDENF